MPRVERDKPLLQALLIRLYQKKIRLVPEHHHLEHEEYDSQGRKLDSKEFAVPKKAKGSTGKLSREEKAMIDDNQGKLLTMLRYDWEYGKELIRDVHGQLAQEYPMGRGCDISEANELIQKALEALEKKNMHGLWYWLHRGLERGLEICEEYRHRPVLDPPKKEEAS